MCTAFLTCVIRGSFRYLGIRETIRFHSPLVPLALYEGHTSYGLKSIFLLLIYIVSLLCIVQCWNFLPLFFTLLTSLDWRFYHLHLLGYVYSNWRATTDPPLLLLPSDHKFPFQYSGQRISLWNSLMAKEKNVKLLGFMFCASYCHSKIIFVWKIF